MDTSSSDKALVPLRANSDYVRWFISDVVADGGAAVLSFAMPLIALSVTGSLTLSGAIAGTTALARVLSMIPGGVIADRYDRRKLLIIGHGCGALIWCIGIVLFFADFVNALTLTGLGVLAGIRDGLFGVVSTPALRQLVPAAQLPQALAANQARDGTIQLVSGPTGGFLVALSLWAPFAARAVGNFLALFAIRTLRANLRPQRENETLPSPLTQVRAGFSWLARRRTITTVLIIAAVMSFAMSGAVQTIVLHFAAVGENSARIGLLPTALASGMIAGSIVAAPIAKRFPTGAVAIISTGVMCAVLALLAVADDFIAIFTILAVSAIALPIFNSAASGWAISQIPDAKIGMISATSGLLNAILTPFAPFIAGFGLDVAGYFPTVSSFIVLVFIGALALAFTGEFRRIPRPDQWQFENETSSLHKEEKRGNLPHRDSEAH